MQYTLKNEKLTIKISKLGGELKSIKDDKGIEYLWQGNPTYWDGQAPNLFPYIARLTNNKYTIENKEYSMDIHGFLKDSNMQALKTCEKELILLLKSSEKTKNQYPFDFEFFIIYKLCDSTLEISYKVVNCGENIMYFSVGGHPGFNVPINENLKFEDYYLQFEDIKENVKRIGFTKDCFLSGKRDDFKLSENNRIELKHNLFDDDAIVLENAGTRVILKTDKDNRSVQVEFSDMKYIGFWHAVKTDAPYICIEPWSALPSRQDIIEDLSKQKDIIHLKANDEYINRWSISIK